MPRFHDLKKSLCACGIALAAATCLPAHAADPAYHIVDTQRLDGNVRWDYLAFDAERHRLYITRGDHVDVFDTTEKKVVGSIPDTHGVHGVAFAPELDQGYTSNGLDNTVTIFALSSLKVLNTVATGERPDAIVYDPASKRVFTANAKSENLSAIDAVTGKLLRSLAVGGKPEFTAVDGKGRLFVNIENKNQLVAVDTRSLTIAARYDLAAACDEPAGLAIDASTERLFVTCHNQKMAVVDGNTGAILATPAIGSGSDAAVFDSGTGLAFSSNGDGTLNVIARNGPDQYLARQSVQTMRGPRTMALDPVSHRLYLVSAEIVPPPETAKPGTRPTMKEGSFTLLTVAP
jgi:DNA-binding beta-propeller fold protein YncE